MEALTIFVNSAILAVSAGIGLLTWRASKRKTEAEAKTGEASAADTLTDVALKLMEPMQERITLLEAQVKVTSQELKVAKRELARALQELAEIQKVEEYLRGLIHEKDTEIATLRARVRHLEEVCRRAGINGHDEEEEAGNA